MGPTLNQHSVDVSVIWNLFQPEYLIVYDVYIIVQAVRGFSVHFWKKLQGFAQIISNLYSSDLDIADTGYSYSVSVFICIRLHIF